MMNVSKCDITGLKKRQKDEWIVIDDSNPNNWGNLYILDDDIFVVEWHGYITQDLNKKADELFYATQKEFNFRKTGYHFVIDQTHVKGSSFDVRARHTLFLQEELPYLKSNNFIGLTPTMKLIVKIGVKISNASSKTKYFDNLTTAISSLKNIEFSDKKEIILEDSNTDKPIELADNNTKASEGKLSLKIKNLKKTTRPEWTIYDINNPENFVYTYLLGDNIYVGEWHGYINNKLNLKSVELHNSICNEFNLRDNNYHFILEQSNVTGSSIKTRAEYLRWLQPEVVYMKSLLYVGLTPITKFLVKSGMVANKLFDIAKYEPDMAVAISNLNLTTTNTYTDELVSDEIKTELCTVSGLVKYTKNEWTYESGNKNIASLSVIDPNVILAEVRGVIGNNDTKKIISIAKLIIEEFDFRKNGYYLILDLSKTTFFGLGTINTYAKWFEKDVALIKKTSFIIDKNPVVNFLVKSYIKINPNFSDIKVVTRYESAINILYNEASPNIIEYNNTQSLPELRIIEKPEWTVVNEIDKSPNIKISIVDDNIFFIKIIGSTNELSSIQSIMIYEEIVAKYNFIETKHHYVLDLSEMTLSVDNGTRTLLGDFFINKSINFLSANIIIRNPFLKLFFQAFIRVNDFKSELLFFQNRKQAINSIIDIKQNNNSEALSWEYNSKVGDYSSTSEYIGNNIIYKTNIGEVLQEDLSHYNYAIKQIIDNYINVEHKVIIIENVKNIINFNPKLRKQIIPKYTELVNYNVSDLIIEEADLLKKTLYKIFKQNTSDINLHFSKNKEESIKIAKELTTSDSVIKNVNNLKIETLDKKFISDDYILNKIERPEWTSFDKDDHNSQIKLSIIDNNIILSVSVGKTFSDVLEKAIINYKNIVSEFNFREVKHHYIFDLSKMTFFSSLEARTKFKNFIDEESNNFLSVSIIVSNPVIKYSFKSFIKVTRTAGDFKFYTNINDVLDKIIDKDQELYSANNVWIYRSISKKFIDRAEYIGNNIVYRKLKGTVTDVDINNFFITLSKAFKKTDTNNILLEDVHDVDELNSKHKKQLLKKYLNLSNFGIKHLIIVKASVLQKIAFKFYAKTVLPKFNIYYTKNKKEGLDIANSINSANKIKNNLPAKIFENEKWNYKSVDGKFSLSVQIINDEIAYRKIIGYPNNTEIEAFIKNGNEILEHFQSNDLIFIEDVTDTKPIFDKNRKAITNFYLSLSDKVKFIVFVGANKLQRATIKMSNYLAKNKITVLLADSKDEALKLVEEKNKNKKEANIITVTDKKPYLKNRIDQLLNIIGRISWDPSYDNSYDEAVVGNDEFSILFESFDMLRKDILSMKKDLEDNSKNLKIEVEKATEELKKKNIELEMSKLEADKSNQLKSAFLANMSHEIRTPMNAIVGLTKVLREDVLTKEEGETYLNLISKSNEHLLNIINDVIDVSKIESGEMNISNYNFNLNEMLLELKAAQNIILRNSEKAKLLSIELNLDLEDETSFIFADKTRLRQVLTNLLNNAQKFTAKGIISFGYKLENDILEFYVKDSGIGIDNSKINQVFERFIQADTQTTRKYGGTGLGLPISKSLVEMWGGSIKAESKLNEGTIFKFTLPYSEGKIVKVKERNTKPRDRNSEKLNILIAEDDELNYIVLKAILKPLKCNITRVVNGKEAVGIIDKGIKFNIVLMDMQMPVMGGLEATKLIKEKHPQIPIIAQTANAFEDDMHKAINAGCIDYITKPLDKEKLLRKINKYAYFKS